MQGTTQPTSLRRSPHLASGWLRPLKLLAFESKVARAGTPLGLHRSRVLFPVVFAWSRLRFPSRFTTKPHHQTSTMSRCVDCFATKSKRELVYRAPQKAWGYAHWAGLPQVWIEDSARRFGFDPERLARRHRLFPLQSPESFQLPTDPALFRAERVRWWVLDATDPRDEPHNLLMSVWVSTGEARLLKTLGPLTLYELIPKTI